MPGTSQSQPNASLTVKVAASLALTALLATGLVVGVSDDAYAAACGAGTKPSGDGSDGDPWQIASKDNLLWVSWVTSANQGGDNPSRTDALADSYLQTADIDLGGCDFTPIGFQFEGTYDGGNFDIEGLAVDEDQAGLFAQLASDGTITRVSIKGGTVTGEVLGALVGRNFGEITDSSSSASVEGRDADGSAIAGGLVGENRSGALIGNSFASGTVVFEDYSEPRYVGGFVGRNEGTITDSTASGDASVLGDKDNDDSAGGFVGENGSTGLIQKSQASGDARSGRDNAGGFVGINKGTIEDSSASGAVVAHEDHAGGFAGFNSKDAEIADSFAVGAVTGRKEVGGFVGENEGTIKVEKKDFSYATGRVIARDTEAGGFVGYNDEGVLSPILTPPGESREMTK